MLLFQILQAGEQSFELAVDGQISEIRYVKDLSKEGRLT